MNRRPAVMFSAIAFGLSFLPAIVDAQIQLNLLSQYSTALGSGGAEIATYDSGSHRHYIRASTAGTMHAERVVKSR